MPNLASLPMAKMPKTQNGEMNIVPAHKLGALSSWHRLGKMRPSKYYPYGEEG